MKSLNKRYLCSGLIMLVVLTTLILVLFSFSEKHYTIYTSDISLLEYYKIEGGLSLSVKYNSLFLNVESKNELKPYKIVELYKKVNGKEIFIEGSSEGAFDILEKKKLFSANEVLDDIDDLYVVITLENDEKITVNLELKRDI